MAHTDGIFLDQIILVWTSNPQLDMAGPVLTLRLQGWLGLAVRWYALRVTSADSRR